MPCSEVSMRQDADRRARDSDGGHEPDYRFTLANERTFLAWVRTALALLAGAVAVVHLVPQFAFPEIRRILGGLLAVISIAAVAGAAVRWHNAQRAMRRDQPLPSALLPWVLAAGIVLVGALVLVLVVAFGVGP